MHEVVAGPPALVVKAETESISGIRELAAAVELEVKQQCKAQDVADSHGLEIGRLICEFASRPEIAPQLAVAIQKSRHGGRPQEPHCVVARNLADLHGGCKIKESYLVRCAQAFLKARRSGLPLNVAVRVAEAGAISTLTGCTDKHRMDMLPTPERLFYPDSSESDEAKACRDEKLFDPSREARAVARKMKGWLRTDQGPRFNSADEEAGLMKALNAELGELEIPWKVVPA